jgi:excisionase family DNA binding protein
MHSIISTSGHGKEQLPLLSERDAADYLAIARRTLWGWRKQGRIPYIRFGSSVRYKREDIDAYIQANRTRDGR